MDSPNVLLKKARDNVICEYKIVDSDKKYAEGIMYFDGNMFNFSSGGSGKGYAEKGHYKAYKLLEETRDAFCMFDFGWQISLEPQFKTERWGIALHPNGGDPKLTKGCFGLRFKTLEENVKCHHLFRNFFDKKDILNVTVL